MVHRCTHRENTLHIIKMKKSFKNNSKLNQLSKFNLPFTGAQRRLVGLLLAEIRFMDASIKAGMCGPPSKKFWREVQLFFPSLFDGAFEGGGSKCWLVLLGQLLPDPQAVPAGDSRPSPHGLLHPMAPWLVVISSPGDLVKRLNQRSWETGVNPGLALETIPGDVWGLSVWGQGLTVKSWNSIYRSGWP